MDDMLREFPNCWKPRAKVKKNQKGFSWISQKLQVLGEVTYVGGVQTLAEREGNLFFINWGWGGGSLLFIYLTYGLFWRKDKDHRLNTTSEPCFQSYVLQVLWRIFMSRALLRLRVGSDIFLDKFIAITTQLMNRIRIFLMKGQYVHQYTNPGSGTLFCLNKYFATPGMRILWILKLIWSSIDKVNYVVDRCSYVHFYKGKHNYTFRFIIASTIFPCNIPMSVSISFRIILYVFN